MSFKPGSPRTASPSKHRMAPEGEPSGRSRGNPLSRTSTGKLMGLSTRRKEKVPEDLDTPVDEADREAKKNNGATHAREEKNIVEFRQKLMEKGLYRTQYDKYMLRRFLRARNNSQERAMEMFLAHLEFRKTYKVDTILEDFEFHEKEAFLASYPQGYHKTDKMGRPIYIQHIGSVNLKDIMEVTTEERLIKYHIQEYERCLRYIMPACSKVKKEHIEQTFAILDLKGVGLKHLTGDVKRMMSKLTSIDQNNYPECLGRTVIINAPSVFKLIFAAVKPMLDAKTQAKIEVCSSDYKPTLLKFVDRENLPEYLGGASQGTLLDDLGPWNDPQLRAEIEADVQKRDKGIGLDDTPINATATNGTILSGFHPGDLTRVTEVSSESPSTPGTAGESVAEAGSGGLELGNGNGPSSSTPDEAYADAESALTTRLSTTSISSDDGYYSPRSQDSGRFSYAGESFRSDRPLISPPAEAEPSPSRATARSNPVYNMPESPPRSPGAASAFDFAAAKPVDSPETTSPATSSVPLLTRVQLLEESIPLIQRGLRDRLPAEGQRLPERLGQGTLVSRVEALEVTVDVLLRAQEAVAREAEERRKKEESSCCACCCIM